jgi:hypothetical protein
VMSARCQKQTSVSELTRQTLPRMARAWFRHRGAWHRACTSRQPPVLRRNTRRRATKVE